MTGVRQANGYRPHRLRRLSLLVHRQRLLLCTLLAICLVVVSIIALPKGSFDIALSETLATLLHPQQASREQAYIIVDIRLPRILMALLSGAMLGLSGAAMQSITRNGLADPGLIGVKEGASISVLALILLLPGLGVFWRPLAGMAGGCAVAVLVALLARDFSRTRFILIGIGISWMLTAGISIFLTTADIRDVETALVWMAGSLHAAGWPMLAVASFWGLAGAVLLLGTTRAADVALLGGQAAAGLGVRQSRLAIVRFAASVMLTAASVSSVGSVGFVGLLAPHISRFTIGGNQTALMTGSALFGALLVLVADTLGRLVFAPLQIPAGIVMSVVGAPFFLLLLWQRRDRF